VKSKVKLFMACITAGVISLIALPSGVAGGAGSDPGISITPSSGSTVSGEVNVVATPVDAQSVSQVYFYLDATFEGTSLSAPYGFSFDASSLSPGTHVIKAYMSDSLGSQEADSDITTTVGSSTTSTTTPTTAGTTSSTTTTNAPNTSNATSTSNVTSPILTSPATPTTAARAQTPARASLSTVGSLESRAASQPPVGLNAYELATDYGVNNGCGSDIHTSTDAFFASLPRGTIVRFWAFQAFGTAASGTTDPNTLDWGPLDSVFAAAAKYGDKLIPVLGNEWAACDGVNDQAGVQKGDSFFSGGYQSNSDEGPLSYSQWVQDVVARYATSSAVYAWEPINEPQDCGVSESQATADLTAFYTAIGGDIHTLSPGSKVEAGFLGTGECGLENGDYKTVGASPGIDILSYHDYYPASTAVGGDQYNGIAVRIQQAQALGKPIIAGEMGITAGTGCTESLAQRAEDFHAKISAQSALGTAAFLFWDWYPGPTSSCVFENITTGDPAISLLHGI
jgi:mannan endo-1,4-beta-mannosidase